MYIKNWLSESSIDPTQKKNEKKNIELNMQKTE